MTDRQPIELLEDIYNNTEVNKAQIALLKAQMETMQAAFNEFIVKNQEIPRINSVNMPTIPIMRPQLKTTEPETPQIQVKASTDQVIEPPPETIIASINNNDSTLVQGKVVSDDGKPLPGVAVKILNENKKNIKTTSTNRAGVWMAQLRAGKYFAKILQDGKPTQYKIIDVKEGQQEMSV